MNPSEFKDNETTRGGCRYLPFLEIARYFAPEPVSDSGAYLTEEVDVVLSPRFRGRGVTRRMVCEMLKTAPYNHVYLGIERHGERTALTLVDCGGVHPLNNGRVSRRLKSDEELDGEEPRPGEAMFDFSPCQTGVECADNPDLCLCIHDGYRFRMLPFVRQDDLFGLARFGLEAGLAYVRLRADAVLGPDSLPGTLLLAFRLNPPPVHASRSGQGRGVDS